MSKILLIFVFMDKEKEDYKYIYIIKWEDKNGIKWTKVWFPLMDGPIEDYLKKNKYTVEKIIQ